MRRTDNVIVEQGLRAAGSTSKENEDKARAYIQSNYIKRELKEHYSTLDKVMELQKAIPSRQFLGVDDLANMVSDRVDRIRSPKRIETINNLVAEMEYVKAIREIFR